MGQHKFSVFSPLFANLFKRFFSDTRYELYRVERSTGGGGERRLIRVETPSQFGVFFEMFFIFFIATVAASRRVFVFHALEFYFAESPRRKGHRILRLKPHKKIGTYFEEHPELMAGDPDYGEEELYASAAEIYDGLIDVVRRRDTVVVSPTVSPGREGSKRPTK